MSEGVVRPLGNSGMLTDAMIEASGSWWRDRSEGLRTSLCYMNI